MRNSSNKIFQNVAISIQKLQYKKKKRKKRKKLRKINYRNKPMGSYPCQILKTVDVSTPKTWGIQKKKKNKIK